MRCPRCKGLLKKEQMRTPKEIKKELPVPIYTRPRAVSVNQNADSLPTENFQKGIITIKILRDVFSVVGSGKLIPRMVDKPEVMIKLLSSPYGASGTASVLCSSGVGSNFDFGINIRSAVKQKYLLLGEYKFAYEAKSDPKPKVE